MSKYDKLELGWGSGAGIASNTLFVLKPTTGGGDFDVERDSKKYVRGSDGLIGEVSSYVPSMEWQDGETCPVLLTEDEATNLALWSNDFDNAKWSKSGSVTITSNAVISPDGTQNADKVNNFDDATGDRVLQVVTITPLATYDNSIWLKAEGADVGKEVKIKARRTTGTTVEESLLVVLTADWTRYNVPITFLADNTAFKLVLDNAGGGNEANSFHVWEAQIELDCVSSNINTEGSTATRERDEITGSEATFNSVSGNLQTTFSMFKNNLSNILSISDGGGLANRVEINSIAGDSDNIVLFLENPSGTKTYTYPIDNTQENHISVEWGDSRIGFRVNGIEVYFSDSFITFTANALTQAQYANVTGTSAFFFGRSKGIDVYSDGEFYNPKFTSFNAMADAAKYTGK